MQIYCLSANILHTQCSRNWLYAKILHSVSDNEPDPNFISLIVLTLQPCRHLDSDILGFFLSWHRFSSWNTKKGSICNLDAKMLLHERAVIHKRAKILQSAIFLHLVDFIHKRKKKQVNKAMQVQKYCLFCDFQLSLIKLVINVSWQLWSSHTQVDLLTIT